MTAVACPRHRAIPLQRRSCAPSSSCSLVMSGNNPNFGEPRRCPQSRSSSRSPCPSPPRPPPQYRRVPSRSQPLRPALMLIAVARTAAGCARVRTHRARRAPYGPAIRSAGTAQASRRAGTWRMSGADDREVTSMAGWSGCVRQLTRVTVARPSVRLSPAYWSVEVEPVVVPRPAEDLIDQVQRVTAVAANPGGRFRKVGIAFGERVDVGLAVQVEAIGELHVDARSSRSTSRPTGAGRASTL